MTQVFKQKIKPSDIKWGFISLSSKIVNQLPSEIKIIYKDQNYHFLINSAGRIVSKKFVGLLELKEGDAITLTRKDDSYELSVQRT